jgi:hypothetical protein
LKPKGEADRIIDVRNTVVNYDTLLPPIAERHDDAGVACDPELQFDPS